MIGADRLSETLAALFSRANGGVVSIVDELLPMCLEHNVELELEANHSRVRFAGGGWNDLKGATLPRAVFRAILARIAAICSDQGHAVSPYGGESELSIGDNHKPTLRIAFCNTPDLQKLTLTPLAFHLAEERNGPKLDRGNGSHPVFYALAITPAKSALHWPSGQHAVIAMLDISDDRASAAFRQALTSGEEPGLGPWIGAGGVLPSGAMVEIVKYQHSMHPSFFELRSDGDASSNAALVEFVRESSLDESAVINSAPDWRLGQPAKDS